MTENLEKKILDKIKKESLAPTPRWHFLLKEWLVWLLGGLSLLVGAAAVSVMLYLSKNNDWMIYEQVGRSFASWFLLSLPYFWLIFLAIFVIILFYNLKHTKQGYRYPLVLIATAAVFASILLGSIFSIFGLGEKIDSVLGRQAPFYDHLFNPHIEVWSHPEEGLLAGLVVSRPNSAQFTLVDRDKGEWNVVYSEKDEALVIIGQPLRAIGRMNGQGNFSADKIMPMRPGKEFFRRMNGDNLNLPPLNNNSVHGGQACVMEGERASLSSLLLKYPELKNILEQGLLDNVDLIKDISAQDEELRLMLNSLNLNSEVLKSLEIVSD